MVFLGAGQRKRANLMNPGNCVRNSQLRIIFGGLGNFAGDASECEVDGAVVDCSEDAIAVRGLHRGNEIRGVGSRSLVRRIEGERFLFISRGEFHFECLLESRNRRAFACFLARTGAGGSRDLRNAEVHSRNVIDHEGFVERAHGKDVILVADFECVTLMRRGQRRNDEICDHKCSHA